MALAEGGAVRRPAANATPPTATTRATPRSRLSAEERFFSMMSGAIGEDIETWETGETTGAWLG